MHLSFLPSQISQLTEPNSIDLAQKIRQELILTPISPQAIATTYVRQGNTRPPILLLHGFDSSVLEFRRLQPLLSAHYETWNVDLLGFGFTDRPADVDVTPETIKTHLYHVWKTLIRQPVVLVGASMGGAVAIDFTLTYPKVVSQLVLIDSAGFAKGPNMSKFMVPPLGYLAAEFLRRPEIRKKVSLQAYADPRFVTEDAELCAALHLLQPRWRQAMIAFAKSGGYTALGDRIGQIQTPTLILWGDSDRILGITDGPKFQAAIAQSQLIWIPQSGHVPHLEKPQNTTQAILNFLASHY
jgi:pimeloyl-ACP methyl ester carboxylesterase